MKIAAQIIDLNNKIFTIKTGQKTK